MRRQNQNQANECLMPWGHEEANKNHKLKVINPKLTPII